LRREGCPNGAALGNSFSRKEKRAALVLRSLPPLRSKRHVPGHGNTFFWFTLCFINSISVSIGVVFPPPTDDDRAPIDTPQKRLASAKEKLKKSQAAPPSSAVNAALTEAHDSVKLLKDMLENPGMTNDIVVDIVKDLHRQQKRIQDLVNDNIDKEKILQLLLGASDHIQTARTVFHLYSYPFSLHVLCRS
jgi:hypothetical protein